MASMELVIEGRLHVGEYGDNYETLLLRTEDDQEPLALMLSYKYSRNYPFWSVRYFISDVERHGDEWTAALLQHIYGDAEIEYQAAFSEITGYLWTDENFMVGGHDLLAELKSAVGGGKKWLRLEITMHTKEG